MGKQGRESRERRPLSVLQEAATCDSKRWYFRRSVHVDPNARDAVWSEMVGKTVQKGCSMWRCIW